ncbi:MAG TPA: hypothetical protein VMC42_00170 [Methanoregulaceae archaeon]|nr:hypothetical protein [Methanoregulaceae archaeon]
MEKMKFNNYILLLTGIILIFTCVAVASAGQDNISRPVQNNLLGNSISLNPDGTTLAFSIRTPNTPKDQ